ncbi:MAG: hypothetical protein IPK76_08170 [Lewinellaceae bacterium]|jgi:hypothetical protein|nr:hypothetical protein [Lewinellaceae bacterium]
MEQLNNEQIGQIMNSTFAGLTLFYRDTNLTDQQASAYKKNMILQELGFTDASYRGGGLATRHRFLIASARAKDASMFEQGTNWGLVILNSGSFFKVLDVYTVGDKTQITLLHIPEEGVDIFAQAKINIEDQIVEKARAGFEEKLAMPPVPELATEAWVNRTQAPIGIDTAGKPFYTWQAGGDDGSK